MELELQQRIRKAIQEELYGVLPVPVIVSFDTDEMRRTETIKVYWPEYQLSWTGRVEEHRYRAQELVRLSFNRNWFTRLIGAAVAPFVQNYVSSNPVTLLPDTNIVYPSGHRHLVICDEEWRGQDDGEDYLLGLAGIWSFGIRADIIRERNGEETANG